MLDPQRFFKGQEPDKAMLDQVMVRRLKTDIKNPDGTERFPARTINAVDITYTDAEREAYDLLQLYTAARRTKPGAAAGPRRRPGDAHPQEAPVLLPRGLRPDPRGPSRKRRSKASSRTDGGYSGDRR